MLPLPLLCASLAPALQHNVNNGSRVEPARQLLRFVLTLLFKQIKENSNSKTDTTECDKMKAASPRAREAVWHFYLMQNWNDSSKIHQYLKLLPIANYRSGVLLMFGIVVRLVTESKPVCSWMDSRISSQREPVKKVQAHLSRGQNIPSMLCTEHRHLITYLSYRWCVRHSKWHDGERSAFCWHASF